MAKSYSQRLLATSVPSGSLHGCLLADWWIGGVQKHFAGVSVRWGVFLLKVFLFSSVFFFFFSSFLNVFFFFFPKGVSAGSSVLN